jgi:hypothetical protein
MFSVLRFPLDASHYYVYISPACLPNWQHGTISYKKKDHKYILLSFSIFFMISLMSQAK